MRICLKFNISVFFIALLIPIYSFGNNYQSIHYTIYPLNTITPIIKIETEIKGNLTKNLIIDLPYKWAGTDYTEQVKNIKLNDSSHGFKIIQKENYQLNITIPKLTNSIKISYELHQKSGDPSNVHETIIRQDLVHAPGYGLFASPSDIKNIDEIEFTIEWKNIPNNWQTLSSHSKERFIKFRTNIQEFLHSIYVAGNLRIYQIASKKNPVFLSLHGTFDVKDKAIVSRLREIIQTQRGFFSDNDFPYYAISIIEGDNPHAMGGTRLHNSFTAYMPKGMSPKDYYILFAHENFHNWVGGKIRNNKDEELNYWWSEGFTDYYSRILALRSGAISIEEFINECNVLLRQYYLSPVINESNSRIKKDFWKNLDVEKLPYYRGFVFAIYLNNLIKNYDDSKSLDNIMLDLFKLSKQQEFSIELFKKIAHNYVPQGINEEISEFIDKGKTIDLKAVAEVIPIEKIEMGIYDLGFDRVSVLNENIIKNINIKSNAYKIGLKNGDKVIKWEAPKEQDPDQIIIIKTQNKTFKFRPESQNKKKIYQFKQKLTPKDKIKIKRFFGAV